MQWFNFITIIQVTYASKKILLDATSASLPPKKRKNKKKKKKNKSLMTVKSILFSFNIVKR